MEKIKQLLSTQQGKIGLGSLIGVIVLVVIILKRKGSKKSFKY